MSIESPADTTPVRRRIVQLPVRTEAPLALIVGDPAPSNELEERLKRAHPVITFPSFSHFLAERPRSQPWVGIVVARSGAWDPRLDGYVRGRRSIALFGLTEESYGFPDAVARIHSVEELDPWVTALTAPEPLRLKERVKREPRSQAKAALTGLVPVWMTKSNRKSERAPETAVAKVRDEPREPEAARRQLELALAISTTDRELAELSARPTFARAPEGALRPPREEPKGAPRRPKLGLSARAPEGALRLFAREPEGALRPRTAAAPVHVSSAVKPRTEDDDRKFLRIAAELGLSRAFELLDELRARAIRVALTP